MEWVVPQKKSTNQEESSDRVILVCANCKKVRNGAGDWKQRKTPINLCEDIIISHGLCPDCMRELYPEVADKVLERNGVNRAVNPAVKSIT